MAYTVIDKPSDYFNTVLYTGNGSTQSITGVNFQPDWVWLKQRSGTSNHRCYDIVRGATKQIYPNLTNAENTETNGLTSFNSDGFSLGNEGGHNQNGQTFASWNWKAGTSFTNDASSTGVGSIDSAGSFNNDAGFSIVSYTGTGGNETIKHGMNITPSMIIFKNRDTTNSWNVYHTALGNGKFIRLEDTGGEGNTGRFNNTSPTSSVFSVGVNGATAVNGNGNSIIAYCFAEVKGYSKFGSYTGNGNADGTFVYTGFKPAWLMIKRTDSANAWIIQDNKRDPFNVVTLNLNANTNGADNNNQGFLDFTANGFKLRKVDTGTNASGGTYIYMCFGSSPFVTSTGIPATAR